MTKCSKTDQKVIPIDIAKQPPAAKQCESCGLDYCDCEICDEQVTIQVPPAE